VIGFEARPSRRLERILAWTCVAVSLAVYSPSLPAPFELQDDHRIIVGAARAEEVGGGLAGFADATRQWWTAVSKDDPGRVGRFRPVNQLGDIVLTSVLGANVLTWRVVLWSASGLAALLLFRLGMAVVDGPWAAAVCSLGVMLAPSPGPAAAWYRLGPKEWTGLLLVVSGLLLLVGRHHRPPPVRQTAGLTLCVLGAASKESFVVLLPALGLGLVLAESRRAGVPIRAAARSIRLPLGVLGFSFALFSSLIANAILHAGSGSYGALGLTTGLGRALGSIRRDALLAPGLSFWLLPVGVALLLALRRATARADAARAAAAVLLAFAICVPQSLLHAPRGGMWDHYWIPCVAGLALLNASAVAWLGKHRERRPLWVVPFLAISCAIWLLNAARVDVFAAANFSEMAASQQAAVDLMSRHVSPNATVVVAGDWRRESERAWSAVRFLEARGVAVRSALFFDTHEGRATKVTEGGLAAGRPWRDVDAGTAASLLLEATAIYCLGDPARRVLARAPFDADQSWLVRSVPLVQRHLSLRKMRLVRIDSAIDLAFRSAGSPALTGPPPPEGGNGPTVDAGGGA
jgi:hypothetical protein